MNTAALVKTRASALDRLFTPKSIAIVGASNRMPGIGGYVTANIARAFKGQIYPVNPREAEIQGLRAYAAVSDLPRDIDLAMIVVPADAVAAVLDAVAAQGIGGAVIITSGFAEVGGVGVGLQEEVAAIVARTGIRVIGPNCIGFMNLADGVMANFVIDPTDPLPRGGPVALISQSGGLGGYMVRKAIYAGLNLGWFVSTGNEVDLSIAATLRHIVEREDTRVLLGACEALRDVDLFIDTALRAAELDKPFILLKAGRSEAAALAAQAHTGSMVGSAAAFDAVCRQYGVFVAHSLEEMLDLGVIFQGGRRARGRRVGIITGSGGAGVILADACILEGLQVPLLPDPDQAMLLDLMPKPFMGSVANPVDVTAQALAKPGAFEAVLTGVPASDAVDMVAPIIIGNPNHPEMYIRAHGTTPKPVAFVSTLLPTTLIDAGIPAYTDPRRAAHALSVLAAFSLRKPRTTRPLAPPPDAGRIAAARAILGARRDGDTLMEVDSKKLLSLYGAPVTREEMTHNPEEAVTAAARIGSKVALKAMSYALPHKSDVGGVRLGLSGAEDVGAGFVGLMADVARNASDARIEGVLVQEMAPARLEIHCGMKRDPVFGPIVVVGLGGVLVEVLGQAAVLQAPFAAEDVKDALRALMGGRLLSSARGLSPDELDAVARLAVALGHAALELPEISEIDVNPVCVADGAALAADGLVVVGSRLMAAVADFLGFPPQSVAVVTGVASGIGHQLAIQLLAQAVTVIGLDINQAGLEKLDLGPGFHARVLNTADRDAVDALFPKLRAEFGPIAYLANNAGPPSSAPLSIEEGLAQTAGSVQIMTAAWSKTAPPPGSAVVNVASVAGTLSGGPPPAVIAGRSGGAMGNGWYGAGKAAIAGLTRYHAVMSAGAYRANAVAPGVIETPRIGDLTSGAYGKLMIERSPLGRLGQPDEVARVIVFLLSPAASFVNGVTLVIDGGGTLVY